MYFIHEHNSVSFPHCRLFLIFFLDVFYTKGWDDWFSNDSPQEDDFQCFPQNVQSLDRERALLNKK